MGEGDLSPAVHHAPPGHRRTLREGCERVPHPACRARRSQEGGDPPVGDHLARRDAVDQAVNALGEGGLVHGCTAPQTTSPLSGAGEGARYDGSGSADQAGMQVTALTAKAAVAVEPAVTVTVAGVAAAVKVSLSPFAKAAVSAARA